MTVYSLDGIAPVLPVDGDYWLAPGTHVVGRVQLCPGASVWFGSVLRGDNEPIAIGEGSNIQEGCVLHTDPGFPLTVGRDCTIGHMVLLHGCTVGNNSLVGMGSLVMNGASIADNSIVGARSLVTEGKTFPEGVLILGSPARVVRSLNEMEISGIADTAAHYRRNFRRMRASLRPDKASHSDS